MASRSPSLIIEQLAPITVSFISLCVIALYRYELCSMVVAKELQMSNVYSAVLSWASIQVGFAFAVYGFVVGKTQGFVEAARDTIAMRRFLTYVKRANIGGFILTALSLPLTALSPNPTDPHSTSFWVVALWVSLFIWTFSAFLRIAYIFGHLSSVRDQAVKHGA